MTEIKPMTKIESLLDKELANIQKNEDVCSDVFGNQKSKILEDRISTLDIKEYYWGARGWSGRAIWSRSV